MFLIHSFRSAMLFKLYVFSTPTISETHLGHVHFILNMCDNLPESALCKLGDLRIKHTPFIGLIVLGDLCQSCRLAKKVHKELLGRKQMNLF